MDGDLAPRKTVDRTERAWLLNCAGMRVETADGLVGEILTPLYEFSARWDRPWGLSVRTESGATIVRMDAIESVDAEAGRILVRETPFVDLGAPPSV